MNKIVIGNWKMNGTIELARSLCHEVMHFVGAQTNRTLPDIVICPPFPYLSLVKESIAPPFYLGAQDIDLVDQVAKGAQTGDVSPSMLSDLGCDYVIIGHSERRSRYGETDAIIQNKVVAAVAAGLVPIICVGETAADRAAGQAFHIVREQMLRACSRNSLIETNHFEKIIFAYEPLWAIGTGNVANSTDITSMHQFMYQTVQESLAHIIGLRMVYGGSVKAGNALSILSCPHVDGVLVGGASLQLTEFTGIIRAAIDVAP